MTNLIIFKPLWRTCVHDINHAKHLSDVKSCCAEMLVQHIKQESKKVANHSGKHLKYQGMTTWQLCGRLLGQNLKRIKMIIFKKEKKKSWEIVFSIVAWWLYMFIFVWKRHNSLFRSLAERGSLLTFFFHHCECDILTEASTLLQEDDIRRPSTSQQSAVCSLRCNLRAQVSDRVSISRSRGNLDCKMLPAVFLKI